mgnify:CR=1 FL=1
MRKSGIKAVIIATALAIAVPTIATTTVTAKKKVKKTVVKLVSLDTAARKYVNKANASANKKKGTTSLKVSVKGSVSEGKFRNAVSKIHCKNVKKITAKVFKSEILCPNWSRLSVDDNDKYTTFEVKFNNKKMHNFSSYGKVNYFEEVEKKIYKNLAVFQKDFGRKLTKAELGTFAVGYCGNNGGRNSGGDGGRTYKDLGGYDSIYDHDYLDSCAKGIAGKESKGVACAGLTKAATRVMRILGFKENECGVVNNDGTNHAWNWWKVSGTIYVGDPTSMGAFFVDDKGKEINGNMSSDETYVQWGNVLSNKFEIPRMDVWKYTEYTSYEEWDKAVKSFNEKYAGNWSDEADAQIDKLYPRVDFETFTKYQPICGFRTITEEECAAVIKKTGDNWYIEPSDGKKGTKWKHSTIHF